MTTEEKARLINLCESSILAHQQYGDESDEQKVYQIALAALTAEPVGKFIQWDSGDEETGPEIEWVEANTKEAIPLYKCAPVAVPEGWRMVPVEPTQNMVDAHMNGVVSGGFQCGYRAMLAAAPAP